VVDSASSDDTLETIADLPLTVVGLSENRGFAHACNAGWRRGDAPHVLFLNPDATIDEQAVRHLVQTAELGQEIGATAPRIVDDEGALDFSMRHFPRLRTTFAQALFLHRVLPRADWSDELIRDPEAYASPASPDWVSGACVLVKRPVLEQLDGLDEGFFMYCEDIDLCRRIRDLSLEIRFDPAAIAVHEGGGSMPRAALLPVLAASRIRYAAKHQPAFVALLERLGVSLGALTHTVVSRGGMEVRRGWARALLRSVSERTSAPGRR
jgi:N-acetylglucosaminyl-diphospho-decaprenol L-rhamnosyltransferase